MNKLDLAHEYALKTVRCDRVNHIQSIVANAWDYADEMYKQMEKRDKFKPQSQWQPDWSVAPDWAISYTIDSTGFGQWASQMPTGISTDYDSLNKKSWWFEEGTQHQIAPSFNFNGDWKQSLRKRPE